MKVRLIGFGAAFALLASTTVCAEQPFGRGSVYATPGARARRPKWRGPTPVTAAEAYTLGTCLPRRHAIA
jgi:hypothetical protein